jgi:hypothetical protein
MPRGSATEIGPWNRRGLTIPPDSPRAWLRLALWELWMGMLLCGLVSFGALLIVTSPDRIIIGEDLSQCYATTVVLPCERIIFRTGGLNAAFSVLCGVMLILAAAWFLWELWSAVEPKPITDDFLKLLNDSFGRNWRDPRTWPWSRMLWAYGFTLVGATLTAATAVTIWTLMTSSPSGKTPTANVETSQRFRVDR